MSSTSLLELAILRGEPINFETAVEIANDFLKNPEPTPIHSKRLDDPVPEDYVDANDHDVVVHLSGLSVREGIEPDEIKKVISEAIRLMVFKHNYNARQKADALQKAISDIGNHAVSLLWDATRQDNWPDLIDEVIRLGDKIDALYAARENIKKRIRPHENPTVRDYIERSEKHLSMWHDALRTAFAQVKKGSDNLDLSYRHNRRTFVEIVVSLFTTAGKFAGEALSEQKSAHQLACRIEGGEVRYYD